MRQVTDTFTRATVVIRRVLRGGSLLLLPVVSLLLTVSCNQSPRCLEETDVFLHARFLTLDEGQDRDTMLTDSRFYGLGREDSLLADGAVHKINLPMNAHHDSCAFVIATGVQKDTLTFRYSRSTRLLSFECGFIAEFSDLRVAATGHFIDSVAVVSDLVTNTDDENVKIYIFRD